MNVHEAGKLLEDFADAAQDLEWQRNEGWDDHLLDAARVRYDAAKEHLIALLTQDEQSYAQACKGLPVGCQAAVDAHAEAAIDARISERYVDHATQTGMYDHDDSN